MNGFVKKPNKKKFNLKACTKNINSTRNY